MSEIDDRIKSAFGTAGAIQTALQNYPGSPGALEGSVSNLATLVVDVLALVRDVHEFQKGRAFVVPERMSMDGDAGLGSREQSFGGEKDV